MSTPDYDDIPADMNQRIAAHIKLYLEHPEQAQMWDARPIGLPGFVTTLLLTTTGRKTGKPRYAPVIYAADGDGYLVLGSKGGNHDHPIWFLNLLENPICDIRVGLFHSQARAIVLAGASRVAGWTKMTNLYPVALKYQHRTDREIPVIRFEPMVAG